MYGLMTETSATRAAQGNERHAPTRPDRTGLALERIARALSGLEYGTVTAVVQNGVVVQVERTEKVRLHRPEGVR